jgi:hypothetical protein
MLPDQTDMSEKQSTSQHRLLWGEVAPGPTHRKSKGGGGGGDTETAVLSYNCSDKPYRNHRVDFKARMTRSANVQLRTYKPTLNKLKPRTRYYRFVIILMTLIQIPQLLVLPRHKIAIQSQQFLAVASSVIKHAFKTICTGNVLPFNPLKPKLI